MLSSNFNCDKRTLFEISIILCMSLYVTFIFPVNILFTYILGKSFVKSFNSPGPFRILYTLIEELIYNLNLSYTYINSLFENEIKTTKKPNTKLSSRPEFMEPNH